MKSKQVEVVITLDLTAKIKQGEIDETALKKDIYKYLLDLIKDGSLDYEIDPFET